MVRINDTTTYPNTTPALADHVIGTDVSDTTNSTDGEVVTFTIDSILDAAPRIKAWVTFDGVSGTSIDASYNVTSVTRNGTGDYTINFTNAMNAATYCVTAICRGGGATDDWNVSLGQETDTKSTTALQIRTIYIGGTTHAAADSPEICVSVIE